MNPVSNFLSELVGLKGYNEEYKGGDRTGSYWNISGYIPGVSIITGCSRALLGLSHLVSSAVLSCRVFNGNKDSRELYEKERMPAFKSFSRGLTEMIPLVGNFFAAQSDAEKPMCRLF